MRACIAFSVSLFSACAPLSKQAQKATRPPGVPVTLEAKDVAAVQDAVRARLKDPGSAQFGRAPLSAARNPNGSIAVCGLVNSKNSFGGYSGARPFFAVLVNNADGKPNQKLTGQLGLLADDDRIEEIVRSDCSGFGAPVPTWQP